MNVMHRMYNIKYKFMIRPIIIFHFRTSPGRPWNPPSLLYNGHRVTFPGVKRPERGVGHLSPSSPEVKGRLELYTPSFSGPSWPDIRVGWTLPLPLLLTLPYPRLSVVIATESNPWVYGRSLAAIAGSNPAGGASMSVSCECCVL
jgi:hypothetical protein